MADVQFDFNPVDWTGFSGSTVLPNGYALWFYNHPNYDGVVSVIGDGLTAINYLDVYANVWQGAIVSPRKITLTTGTYNDQDVEGYSVIQADTSSGDVVINGLTGGKSGQYLIIYKTSSSNNLTINHNSGLATDQALIMPNGFTITRNRFGAVMFLCNGTNWFTDACGNGGITITTGTYNAEDVSSADYIIANTSGGDITLNGLTGGINGQTINIIKPSPANNLIITHNSGSAVDQSFITELSATVTKTAYGNIQAFCNGSNWFIDE